METSMLSQVIRMLFFTFALIGLFLLIGTIVRAKVKTMQKLFLPASVIGGFVGLLLGPIILKQYAILPIPQDWLSIASILPGLLIVPVVASVPLGLKFGSKDESGNKKKGLMKPVGIMLLLMIIIGSVQNFFGLSMAGIFKLFPNYADLYPTFGTELSAGYAGGHGTAGVIGSMLQSMNQPYWEVAQGVTTTTATVGLISGILVGILLINIAARKGYTKYLTGDASLPEDMRTGVQKDLEKQQIAGKESTNSASIDALALHLSLILGVSGLSFLLTFVLKKYNVLVLNSIPEWAYAIILMYIVWGTMQKLKLDWVVDNKTKSKIASTFADFAIVAAIMSLPIQAVFTYIVPLSAIMIGGLLLTIAASYYLSKLFFKDHWFERSMVLLGTNTGVFLTGLLLLKMVDSDMKSPVLADYSIAYSFNSIIGFVLFPLSFGLLINQGLGAGMVLYVSVAVIASVLLFVTTVSDRKVRKGV
ncbi:sodium/glutamate symporter [Sporosarcina oncorhynchi]|uniref:Sodium/glutamate symporter n=1 Tax=Sporosarcina oncorhynchi TaxID=3056444 RepID=A0ABZ0L6H5_9BACL|nr:sodium/glutamate symporter [Sporosarcina sp. T2O-4]WOV88162.1 sodium/glutamate symporter [Sporosarcina sp. T2O-4]